ncbi:AMP-binding enzyme, partial [Stenotrophomonas maltophilia]|uniref:AMP-binding enzyme n=1 Tax=Stenotrophomonas maltophilia TaxID=40324 RepID=UPI0013DB0A1D
ALALATGKFVRQALGLARVEPNLAQPSVDPLADLGAAGEAVKAYIVRRPGADITSEQIRAFCKEHLTAYKVPKFVEFRDELPKS